MGSIKRVIILSIIIVIGLTTLSITACAKYQAGISDVSQHCDNINHEDGISLGNRCEKPIKVMERKFFYINHAGAEVSYYVIPLKGGRYHYVYLGLV